MYNLAYTNVSYFVFFVRLLSREILDQLKVARFQETLLIFNENVDMAVAHVSVSRFVTFPTWCSSSVFAVCDLAE